eukprot:scaffold242058_cov29-Tisochrysis_lutea.AAC.5
MYISAGSFMRRERERWRVAAIVLGRPGLGHRDGAKAMRANCGARSGSVRCGLLRAQHMSKEQGARAWAWHEGVTDRPPRDGFSV